MGNLEILFWEGHIGACGSPGVLKRNVPNPTCSFSPSCNLIHKAAPLCQQYVAHFWCLDPATFADAPPRQEKVRRKTCYQSRDRRGASRAWLHGQPGPGRLGYVRGCQLPTLTTLMSHLLSVQHAHGCHSEHE